MGESRSLDPTTEELSFRSVEFCRCLRFAFLNDDPVRYAGVERLSNSMRFRCNACSPRLTFSPADPDESLLHEVLSLCEFKYRFLLLEYFQRHHVIASPPHRSRSLPNLRPHRTRQPHKMPTTPLHNPHLLHRPSRNLRPQLHHARRVRTPAIRLRRQILVFSNRRRLGPTTLGQHTNLAIDIARERRHGAMH
jgi:hypothetical protein